MSEGVYSMNDHNNYENPKVLFVGLLISYALSDTIKNLLSKEGGRYESEGSFRNY